MSPEERFSSRKWGDHLTDLQNLVGGGDLAFEDDANEVYDLNNILLIYVEHQQCFLPLLMRYEKFGRRLLMFWQKIAIFVGHSKNLWIRST